MDCHPLDICLLTTVGSVEVSAMPNADCRGLLITIEEPAERIQELALTQPVVIRNAVYAVVNAMGESLRFTGMGKDTSVDDLGCWYEFAAERQRGDD